MFISSKAKESVSYLRGLIDGQNPKDEAQRKLYDAIVSALDAITDELCSHAEAIDDIDDSIVDIYDALDELDDEFCDDDADFLETKCPHCGETIFFDDDMLDEDSLICPLCNEEIELFDEEEDDKNLPF